MNLPQYHITIMAGGTGGHIMPGLAVARALVDRQQRVSWLGSANSLEQRLAPEHALEFHALAMRGLRGAGWGRWLLMPWQLTRAVWQALRAIKTLQPDCVVSMGGFAAAPGGIAAWLLRIPLVVHEQNRIPGLTNRMLARVATQVCQAFADSFPAARAAVTVGNPVRAEIIALRDQRKAGTDNVGTGEAAAAVHVLILGGSQGANALNQGLPRILAALSRSLPSALAIRHQCGERWQKAAEAVYAPLAAAFITLDIVPFIDDMAAAYGWADVVLARAGAMTVSELAAVGLASVLIPYPFAVDDHQSANAQVLVAVDAALMIAEDKLTSECSQAQLQQLLADRTRLRMMGRAAAAVHRHDAAGSLADICLELCA